VILGVTGDTHNNLKNIKKICAIFTENSADLVVHTGDISLPKSLIAFNELNCPLIAVFGNNDIEERNDLEEASKKFDCKLFDEPHSLSLNHKNILILHHPELIDCKMIEQNDLILHGHTHRYRLEKKMNCIIFNPGECAGIMEGKNQVGIVDLKNLRTKIINF
jgi:putative phosphoesterase